MDYRNVKLSVCIPTYNRIKYLKLVLENLFSELSSIDYELVVADGGSTDGTIDYLSSLKKKKKNITLIKQKHLTGATKAFLECCNKANGHYIMPLTDHDFICGKTTIENCKILDMRGEIDGIVRKIYITSNGRAPYKVFVRVYPYIIACEAMIFRKNNVKDIDNHYHTAFWYNDLMLNMFVSGKTVAHARNISGGQIQIKHKDCLHDIREENNTILRDRQYFQKKWYTLNQIIEMELPAFCKFKVRIMRSLLRRFIHFLKKNKFIFLVDNAAKKIGFTKNVKSIFPGFVENEFQNTYNQKLDRRYQLLMIEKIMDRLYEGSSAFVVNDFKKDDEIFLVQRLSNSIIEKFNQLKNV